MNKALTLGLGLLLGGAMAVAQSTTAGSPQATSSNPGSSNQTTVQGCLSGSHDNWTLADANGQTWKLKGDDSNWGNYSGHTVAVTGSSESTAVSAQSNGTTATATATTGNGNGGTINVNNVQDVSASCSSSGSMPQSGSVPPASTKPPDSTQPPASSSTSTGSSLPPSGPSDMNSQSSSTQSSASQSSTQSTTGAMPQSGAVSGSSAENGIRGCLQGQSGSFTLRADDGRMFQLTGDTSKLNDNLNKEVQITGNSGSSATSSNSSGQSSLNVTDVQKISDTCSSGMPQGSTPPASTATPPSSSTKPPDGPADPEQDPTAQSATPATPQSGAATPQSGTATTDQAATPDADQKADHKKAKGGALPQTASPLPLMGLIGAGSLVSGFIARLRK
ncbi:MAG: hypothetical protein JO041_14800 [Acidobacteria bacterium]|nr:hypothetical protein [Acidobacteriota bacterium]